MAKARRPPFAAAERFLGFPRGGSVAPAPAPAPAGGFGGDDDDLPDLAEADVWYSAAAAESGSPCPPSAPRRVEPAEGGRGSRAAAARRGVQGGLSRAFGEQRPVAASAPVEVSAWPARFAAPGPEPASALLFDMELEEEDEAAGAGAGWVPPHLYLARRQARASVVEGAGRTLKGRDMSRVRDAVWSRTGFDG